MPVATGDHLGELVTVTGLGPTTDIVRTIMRQDRDLSAWIAKRALSRLVLATGADFDEVALPAAGLERSPEPGGQVTVRLGTGAPIADVDAAGAIALANLVIALSLMRMLSSDEDRRSSHPWPYFEDLYTGASGEDVETSAYEITAWVCVVVGRLQSSGSLRSPMLLTGAEYREMPIMSHPGWYPNPGKNGEIRDGDAEFQRYWDGAWTDRVRVRDGRGWETGTLSLHRPQ